MSEFEPKKNETETEKGGEAPLRRSTLYQEFLAEREEILRHKWIESEKAGYDIGFEKAFIDWNMKHCSTWRRKRKASPKS